MKNDPIAEVRTIKQSQPDEMLTLEELIKNHIQKIDELNEEIKNHKEMFEDSFNNDPLYREHTETVKKATKAKKAVRDQIRKQPSVAQLEHELKDMQFEQKEMKKTLSDLLLDYKERTGATQLELFDGQIVEIVESAKVVKAKSK